MYKKCQFGKYGFNYIMEIGDKQPMALLETGRQVRGNVAEIL